ncbi:putative trans-sialidase [Trypanosoma cruzi]|uniref:Trans-sialidase, putative n=2 Tax=Trypanosoma cruzi TaxID=5693 RepID=Q4E0C8_TRYCC|nr:trans-sialidase, putative [Trypanosoma cruzi]EAN98223.1 trans-sialidase, putative [Trypanosoma cruzi]PWV19196.1 putative trans-sialidase [Trypanosoma cruzi]|eukprot:XP_820074.1 trans-sialidase [Trypanosoma cruzi strain CL Brener]
MLSRIAAVKALCTDNRCRMTGCSGRRREGRESGQQRPNMSRRVFASAVLLLVVMVCFGSGAAHAVESNSGDAQLPNEVAILVPEKTLVVSKGGKGQSTTRVSFVSPSLVRAGGVMTVLAEGWIKYTGSHKTSSELGSADIVAGYISAAETWPSIVAEVTSTEWRAHTVLGDGNGDDLVGVLRNPTSVGVDNKAFLLVGNYSIKFDATKKIWQEVGWDIRMLVGEATHSLSSGRGEWIEWAAPISLMSLIPEELKSELKEFMGGGGSGIVTYDDTIVFPLTARNQNGYPVSLLIYSKDKGNSWVVPKGVSPVDCFGPRIIEWDYGTLLMVTDCLDGRKVFESNDMGESWTEAVGALSWLSTDAPPDPYGRRYLLGSIITAIIEGNNLVLYTQKGRYPPGERGLPNAFYLWATNGNRTFHTGRLSVDDKENKATANTLLYSGDALHLAEARGTATISTIYFSRLTEELEIIKSLVRTWERMDAFFSMSHTPTDGLVGFLSNTAIGPKWMDEYLCVNATVTNGVKVQDGFKFPGDGSGATWPVNSRKDNVPYTFANKRFTLVATVVINELKTGGSSNPLLGAVLDEPVSQFLIGVSYNTGGKWETVFKGKTTTQSSTWETGKRYQVVLMLSENEGSVYVNGELVGSSETIPTSKERVFEVSHFQIGGDERGRSGDVTVMDVFLYNRRLTEDELKTLRKGGDGSMRGGVSRVLMLLLLGLCGIAVLY